jgi:PadR family transcriptional regulator
LTTIDDRSVLPSIIEVYRMFSRELSAATAKPAVLAILVLGESYGYDIIRQIKDLSGGEVEWGEGALYPVLHRLERQGFIESRWRQAETGRRRKYYSILPKGAKASAEERVQWQLADSILSQLWNPTPSLT